MQASSLSKLSRALSVGVVVACTALSAAHATLNPAGKFYDDALNRYERRDYVGAVLQLKTALQHDQKMLAAHLLLGRILLLSGELKPAEAALEEALKQGVSRAEVLPLLGQVYLRLGEARKVTETITLNGMPTNLHAEILTLRGTAQAMMGTLSVASESFAEARRLDPKSPAPLIAEAPVLLRFGERDRARTVAQKAVDLASDSGLAWYQLGTVQLALNDPRSALASFDKAVELMPKYADAHVSRALALMSLGRNDEGEKVLDHLKASDVSEPRASWMRGTLAQQRGQAAVAKAEFSEAVNLIDPMPPALRSGSEPLLLAGALSHRTLGNREKAREYLNTLLSRNPQHYAGQMLLASMLVEGNDFRRALPLLEALTRVAPDDPQTLYMLGTTYMARKQYVQAAEVLDKAVRSTGSSAALRELSFSQFGLGQDKVGLANLEKAFAKTPADLRAGIELAVVYARTGQAAKAIKVAESLVKLDPDNLAMLNFLGNIKGRLGDKKGTREAYLQVLRKDPKFRIVVINMSWLDMEEGNTDDARARLQDFLKDKPNDADMLFQLGLLEYRANRVDEALAHWTKADSLQAKDARSGLALIDLYLAQRQIERAQALGKAMTATYPGVIPVQIARARVHVAAGELPLARQVLSEAATQAGFDPVPLATIGRMQLQIGHVEGAVHSANKALQSRPDDLAALVLLVEAAAKRGNAADVDAAMRVLAAKHPGNPASLTTQGHIAFSRKQLPQAIANYRAAFDREPSSQAALMLTQAYVANNEGDKALVLLEGWGQKQSKDQVVQRALAEVQVLAGKTEAAKKTYAAVVAAHPDDPALLAGYALLLQNLGDGGALSVAQKAAKLAPNNAVYADILGWLLVSKGDIESGVRVLRDARLRDPGNGQIRWHFAVALSKAGRKAEARDELQAALASATPPPAGPELTRLKAEMGL